VEWKQQKRIEKIQRHAWYSEPRGTEEGSYSHSLSVESPSGQILEGLSFTLLGQGNSKFHQNTAATGWERLSPFPGL
jgi:hypothetical protein